MPYWLLVVVTVLAVARLTRLVTVDYLLHPLRERVAARFGPDGNVAYLVSCPWCLSVWLAGPVVAVAVAWPDNRVVQAVMVALAASHVAGLLIAELESN
jgi:hypothetical protein